MNKIVIVGGGIVGVATAYYLSRYERDITLIEPDAIGGGTTAASMGHLTILDGDENEFLLSQRSLQLWSALSAALPPSLDYRRCGTLWLACDDEELTEAQRKARFYQAHDVRAQCIDAKQLHELEPQLASDLCGGLHVPDDAILYPPLAAKYLFDEARSRGVRHLADRVIAVADHQVMTANQTVVTGDIIIVCVGNDSRILLPDVPIRSKKGHLAITERGPSLLTHQVIELGYIKNAHMTSGNSVAANIQARPTGQLLIGSSRQFDEHNRDINWSLLRAMLKRAQRFLPVLATQNTVRVWTGLRPTTPDNLPLIGVHDQRRGIWLNTGHEGLGVATALASAELITAQLGHGRSPLTSDAFSPQRFIGAKAA